MTNGIVLYLSLLLSVGFRIQVQKTIFEMLIFMARTYCSVDRYEITFSDPYLKVSSETLKTGVVINASVLVLQFARLRVGFIKQIRHNLPHL